MADTLHFPDEDAAKLASYLPPPSSDLASSSGLHGLHGDRPFVTLTFATSLDASLALAPGVRTALSGPQSKAMTHYLRSRHDAICVGVGTAVADDPGLNCRIAGGADEEVVHQPRPIVIDPHDRWPLAHDSRVLATARCGRGLAPFVVTAVREPDAAKRQLLESHGGKYIVLSAEGAATGTAPFRWEDILRCVAAEGLRSIMIEGGGGIINTLLAPANSCLVDVVIVTIAPTWLGRGGVVVSPERVSSGSSGSDKQPTTAATAVARLTDVQWQQLGEDVVLCGRFKR